VAPAAPMMASQELTISKEQVMANKWFTRLTIGNKTHVYPWDGFKTKKAATEFQSRANKMDGCSCIVFKEAQNA
jgi:hypothetical protein